jgi:hypothetical protein
MNKSESAMPVMSIAVFAPISIEILPGTTIGARIVSSRISVRQRAISPLRIIIQIKPDTAVGPENKSTKPETTSLLAKKAEDTNIARTGINTWAAAKNNRIGNGLRKLFPSSAARSFNAPENVIKPKRRGTYGLNTEKTEGSKKPITMLNGVVAGINRSRKWLNLNAAYLIFLKNGI